MRSSAACGRPDAVAELVLFKNISYQSCLAHMETACRGVPTRQSARTQTQTGHGAGAWPGGAACAATPAALPRCGVRCQQCT
jgi:hypothetical protein